MKTYMGLVHKDEGSAYGITFPDLPGCFSAADDLSDLVPNACEAIELWFEDAGAVEPRDVLAVQAEVMDDLRAGAFLIGVPYIKRTTVQQRVNISMDSGTLEAIDAYARRLKLTRSAFLTMAASNEIKQAREA